jgi:hypothetical protein
MTTPTTSAPITALVAMLTTAIPEAPGGDGTRPTITQTNKPYWIVYEIPGGNTWGGLSNPDQSLTLHVQVSSVGRTRAQAAWCRDKVRSTILNRSANGSFQVTWPTMDNGCVCIDRELTDNGGCIKDGEPPNEYFTYADRFSITITPS